ncbi:hypothetical protein V1514DRAFT_281591 [Lipomyces japonicus]|uniref:uncharacterized protein n=1 Tax=Lipomyces japonicus TaxID=56871 RepID=UPI0034CF4C25
MSIASSGAPSPAFKSLPFIVGWDVSDVCNWLDQLGLWQYRESFQENDITGEVLIHLDHDFLKELGVSSVGHRLQILKAVYNVKVSQDIPIEPGQFVPLDQDENDVVDIQRLVKSLEIRDRRILQAEQEIRRLMDSHTRLREDLLPIFKLVKESKPLPMPDPATHNSSTRGSTYSSHAGAHLSHQSSNRHSMFIPQATSMLSPPLPSQTPGLSRKISKKFAKPNPSPTHVPEWLEGTLIPSGNSTPTDGVHLLNKSSSSTQLTSLPMLTARNNGNPGASPTTTATATITAAANAVISNDNDSNINNNNNNNNNINNNSNNNNNSSNSYQMQQNDTVSITSGNLSSSLAASEPFRRFKLKLDDPCYKVLPAVLKGHNIVDDWRQYALLVCYGDQERVLGLDEKPLSVMKDLQEQGKQPVFMLRSVQGLKRDQGALVTGTPGGVL